MSEPMTNDLAAPDERGPSILLVSGMYLHPFDPLPEQIQIEDIAYGLAGELRWGGHTRPRINVAHHSILVAHYVGMECELRGLTRIRALTYRLEALLHDAAEGVGFRDLPGPMKRHPLLAGYKAGESALQDAIQARYGLPPGKSEIVGLVDKRVEATEMRDLEPRRVSRYEPYRTPLDVVMDAEEAEEVFLREFHAIQREIGSRAVVR